MDDSCNDKKKIIGKALRLAGQLFDPDPSEQALLTEYEVGHDQVISIGSAIWYATSIFLSINGLALTFFFTREIRDPIDSLLLTTVVGIIFILILNLWKQWMNRETALTQIIYERMREIETYLRMWKNRYVHLVDQLVLKKTTDTAESYLRTLPKEKFDKIKQLATLHRSAREHKSGRSALGCIAQLLMVGWGLLIIREWISVCFPEFHTWLLNILN